MGIFFEKCPAWAGRMMMMPRPRPDDERRTLVVRLLLRSATATAHLFASCSALYQKTHSVDHFSRHYSQLKELKATKTTGAVAVALLSNSRTTSVLRSSSGRGLGIIIMRPALAGHFSKNMPNANPPH